MDAGREQEFTAFYDTTWQRTVACAYGMTADLSAAELHPGGDVYLGQLIAWGYGSTAVVALRPREDDPRVGLGYSLFACDADALECAELPTTGALVLPSS